MSNNIEVKISSFELVCIYNIMAYTVGVTYMYIYEKVFDMDFMKQMIHAHQYGGA